MYLTHVARAVSDNLSKQSDSGKTYESTLVVPNVTSVLLNHEKPSEPERSQFQPVSVHTAQVTVVKHQFVDQVLQKPSKRVPVKIVQDNRKIKPKTEISKTEVPVTKMCATVSLKQVNGCFRSGDNNFIAIKSIDSVAFR